MATTADLLVSLESSDEEDEPRARYAPASAAGQRSTPSYGGQPQQQLRRQASDGHASSTAGGGGRGAGGGMSSALVPVNANPGGGGGEMCARLVMFLLLAVTAAYPVCAEISGPKFLPRFVIYVDGVYSSC